MIDKISKLNAVFTANPDKLVIVDFFANWCGPCMQIKPKYEAMSKEERFESVVFLMVDVDQAEDITEKYSVEHMPSFYFFKGGNQIDKMVGANEKRLVDMIVKNMGQ